jgi:uncharacterized membrane protein
MDTVGVAGLALMGFWLGVTFVSRRKLVRILRCVGLESGKRLVRRWSVGIGLLFTTMYWPLYADVVVRAARERGAGTVVMPALAAAVAIIVAGLWTGAWFGYFTYRKYRGSPNGQPAATASDDRV